MDAAEDLAALLHAVANNPAVAVWANWRERMNRALGCRNLRGGVRSSRRS